jgi:hypothetical protein
MRFRSVALVSALVLVVAAALTSTASAGPPQSRQAAAIGIRVTSPNADSRNWFPTSTQVISWEIEPGVSSGEFRVSLVGSSGAHYLDRTVLPVPGQTKYSSVVAILVPAGTYEARVYWRPTTGSGAWAATARSVSFKVGQIPLAWRHALQVIANLREHPVRRPLVLLLGDSTTREATISDASLRRAISKASGRRVAAYDLASTNAGFNKDSALVPFIPNKRTVVFICVNLIRFIAPGQPEIPVTLPPAAPFVPFEQHLYDESNILSPSQKQIGVTFWRKTYFPVFYARVAENMASLDQLIASCKARGLHPVLLESARDTAAIGTAWDAPLRRSHAGCVALAAKYRIPYADFVRRARFVTSDFFDLWHAVQPGRAKYQKRLAARAGRLIDRYFPVN